MIPAIIATRFLAANKLYELSNELQEIRSSICFTQTEVMEIDDTVATLDKIIKRIMK